MGKNDRNKYRWPASALTEKEMGFLTDWRQKTGTPISKLLKQAVNVCQDVLKKEGRKEVKIDEKGSRLYQGK